MMQESDAFGSSFLPTCFVLLGKDPPDIGLWLGIIHACLGCMSENIGSGHHFALMKLTVFLLDRSHFHLDSFAVVFIIFKGLMLFFFLQCLHFQIKFLCLGKLFFVLCVWSKL